MKTTKQSHGFNYVAGILGLLSCYAPCNDKYNIKPLIIMHKILIVQFRTDQSEAHEQKCLREQLKNLDIELKFVSAIKGEKLSPGLLDNVKGVIFGGSGEFYMSDTEKTDKWLPQVNKFIDEVISRGIPLFGLCLGFQILALHQGAKIIRNENTQEVGAFTMTLSEAGKQDPLFFHIDKPFMVHLGHKEAIVDLPDHLVNLGSTEKVGIQGFRWVGKPVWGVIFHSELNKKTMTERFFLYYDSGNKDYANQGADETVSTFSETPEAFQVLINFVKYALQYSSKE